MEASITWKEEGTWCGEKGKRRRVWKEKWMLLEEGRRCSRLKIETKNVSEVLYKLVIIMIIIIIMGMMRINK